MTGTFAGNILITGSRGQLGGELMRALSERYSALGVSRADLDITDKAAVTECLRAVKPTVVIHSAAWTDVDGCEQDPARAEAVNADGTRFIARACRELGASMVYFSTDYVFDGKKSAPYVESDPPNPLSVYGRSKLAGEEAVRELVEQYVILRVGWVYGKGGKNFVNTMINLGSQQTKDRRDGQKVEPIRVVSDQTGCPTGTLDIAQQTERILARQLFGTFHCACSGQTNWFELARTIFGALSMPVDVVPCTTAEYGSPAPRPAYSALDNQRLKEQNCNVMRPYRVALDEFLATYRETTT
jgi:dTDP-4-dehydrorhamnose reductase